MLLSEGYLAMLSMIETVNNAKIYGSAFINGPDHATDLDGNFVNRQAVQDAGINTILLAAPAIGAELQGLKIGALKFEAQLARKGVLGLTEHGAEQMTPVYQNYTETIPCF